MTIRTRMSATVLSFVCLLSGVTAPAADATTSGAHHRTQGQTSRGEHPHAKRPRHRARPVTTCAGVGQVGPQAAWFDRYGNHTSYPSKIVCSAADHSTVRIKMYFVVDAAGQGRTFLRDVDIMHRYHHVNFIFLVDSAHHGKTTRRHMRESEEATPGTHWFGCANGCESSKANAISHSKFIALSEMRGTHRPALFTTSVNISDRQLTRTVQSGILFNDNAPLYRRFVDEFAFYRTCATHRRCNRRPALRQWQTYGAVAVYFTPATTDPIANDLKGLDCSGGGTIEVASLWLRSKALVSALNKDHEAGCTVRVVVEHPELDRAAAKAFGARTEIEHDKYLIVRTPSLDRLYAGTQDFSSKALHTNDNFMLRTSRSYLIEMYQREFEYQWRRSAASRSSRGHAMERSAMAKSDV